MARFTRSEVRLTLVTHNELTTAEELALRDRLRDRLSLFCCDDEFECTFSTTERMNFINFIIDAVRELLEDRVGPIVSASDADLPTVADLVGSDPEFTGGLSAAEYVRRLRGDLA